jgi:hypothetical protein
MREKKEAAKILNKMYKEFRKSITAEQWEKFKAEIKQASINLDGKVLEGAELEETAKANVMVRLAQKSMNKGKANL